MVVSLKRSKIKTKGEIEPKHNPHPILIDF